MKYSRVKTQFICSPGLKKCALQNVSAGWTFTLVTWLAHLVSVLKIWHNFFVGLALYRIQKRSILYVPIRSTYGRLRTTALPIFSKIWNKNQSHNVNIWANNEEGCIIVAPLSAQKCILLVHVLFMLNKVDMLKKRSILSPFTWTYIHPTISPSSSILLWKFVM